MYMSCKTGSLPAFEKTTSIMRAVRAYRQSRSVPGVSVEDANSNWFEKLNSNEMALFQNLMAGQARTTFL